MDKCTVSVVIPVYNAGSYIRETLDSVINQTFSDIEIICVDDGSTDDSVEVVKSYAEKDLRIKQFFQREPSDNAGKARNMGLRESSGKYVIFLDADDIFEHNLIEVLVDIAEEKEADTVIFDGFVYDDYSGEDLFPDFIVRWPRLKGRKVFEPGEVADNLFQIKTPAAWNMMCRREYIIRNNIEFRSTPMWDDIEFSCLSLAYSKRIAVCEKRLLHYRKNASDNQSSRVTILLDYAVSPYIYLGEELRCRGLLEKYRSTFLELLVQQSVINLRYALNYDEAEKLYKKAKDVIEEYSSDDIDNMNSSISMMLDMIVSSNTYSEFLFAKSRIDTNEVYDDVGLRLPAKRLQSRIILYGAGVYGKTMRMKLRDEKNIEFVGWCDRNYKNYERDIESPNILKEREYDYIVVAVIDRSVYEGIKKSLIDTGIESDRITWIKALEE